MTQDERARDLQVWLREVRPDAGEALVPITGDASFRRYFRVPTAHASLIAMDAPPGREDVRPFVDIARRLEAAGLNAPRILASDVDNGFLLLTDLGDRLYLDALADATADELYADALSALAQMQTRIPCADLPVYDETRLHAEMELFPQWFLGRHLGVETAALRGDLDSAFERLAAVALEQPRVFVHRDYHSRNLLVTPSDNPGILDFQDAVAGPITYDLASLLRDCYVAWPAAAIERWLEHYAGLAETAGLTLPARATLRRWFDLMGVQRHLKAIGIFARLWHRDGKPRYLGDIPRTWGHIAPLLPQYRELAPLARIARDLDLDRRIAASAPVPANAQDA